MRLFRNGPDDSGAVAMMVAIFVIAFVALSAIVIDVGYMFDTRRQLQAVAEAAALAGCQELIASDDPAAARAVAEEYAHYNTAIGPVDDLVIEEIQVDTGEGSVRVIVAQDSPAFFSRMFGPEANTVRAAAKAQKWLLTGGRYLVPWAVPTIRNVDRVEVAVLDGAGNVINSTTLGSTGGLSYAGSLAAPGAAGAYDLRVRIYNTYGVPELLIDSSNNKEAPAGVIRVTDPSDEFSHVSLSEDFITLDSGPWPVLTAVTISPQAEVGVEIDGTKHSMMSADGVNWSYQITASDVDDTTELFRVYGLDVYVGSKPDKDVDAYLHVRRDTHPISDLDISPTFVSPGGSFSVSLELSDFYPTTAMPGQTYVLRVASPSSEVGNFGELNYNKIVHTASCPPDPVEPAPGNNYYDWTAYGYEGGIHVGDIIEISPGSSGANTEKALDERQSLLPPGESMVVVVPVVEKYEDKGGGSYDVIVEAFAAFKILSYDKSGEVTGEFLEYVANPASFAGSPGGPPNAAYAARLVNP